MKLFTALFCLLLLASCQRNNDDDNVVAGLQPYYDSFLKEAADRNYAIPIDKDDISLLFTDIASPSVLGQCRHNAEMPEVVEIDRFHWETFDEATKEFVVFHELGHCILDRGHKDSVESNGDCASLMHSTVGLCAFEFTGADRDKYIDELFNF